MPTFPSHARYVLSFVLSLLTLLISAVCCAETPITASPAVVVTYDTKPGVFYQLQVQRDGSWEDEGVAVQGTGKQQQGFLPSGEYRVVTPKNTWALVWADEFDGEDLDYSKWEKEENNYGGGNFERQAYRTDPKYCVVKDGVLHLSVYRDAHTTSDGKTQPYSSARLRSRKRGDWAFGRFEIRAKMPRGEGIWPAVWLLPTDSPYGGWAASGEIDIIESRGSAVHETTGALHFGGPWPRNTHLSHAYTFPKENAAEEFHLYALEWNANQISWYVDGELCRTRTNDEWFSEAASSNPSAPFDQPFHLVVNVAVDGRFFENTDQQADRLPKSAFPQTLEIDFIRVYQWAE